MAVGNISCPATLAVYTKWLRPGQLLEVMALAICSHDTAITALCAMEMSNLVLDDSLELIRVAPHVNYTQAMAGDLAIDLVTRHEARR